MMTSVKVTEKKAHILWRKCALILEKIYNVVTAILRFQVEYGTTNGQTKAEKPASRRRI